MFYDIMFWLHIFIVSCLFSLPICAFIEIAIVNFKDGENTLESIGCILAAILIASGLAYYIHLCFDFYELVKQG